MSLDLYTLADARAFLGTFVDNGTCSTPTIDGRIDEAQRRLMAKPEVAPKLRRRMRFVVRNRVFAVPSCVETILWADVDGAPTQVWSDFYEFLSGGPGDLEYQIPSSGLTKALVDLGDSPLQYDIPTSLGNTGYNLVAFSKEVSDFTKTLTLRGLDSRNDAVGSVVSGAFVPGEALPINHWQNGTEGLIHGAWSTDVRISTGMYRQLVQVNKPLTASPISLYAVVPSTNAMYLLAKFRPDEKVPHYRRYRVTNTVDTGDDTTTILTLVRIRYEKATQSDDALLIQNLDALKNMVIAISKENSGDLQGFANYEANAVRLLLEQKSSSKESRPAISIIDVESSIQPAYAMNRGRIL